MAPQIGAGSFRYRSAVDGTCCEFISARRMVEIYQIPAVILTGGFAGVVIAYFARPIRNRSNIVL